MSPALHRKWLIAALLPTLAAFYAAAGAPSAARAEAPAPAKADPALDNEPAEYMRFVDDKKGGGLLQVASGTYKNDSGVTVHLVGAVHIGEKRYYDELNKAFEKYDSLLYEMVKPADTGAPRKGPAAQA